MSCPSWKELAARRDAPRDHCETAAWSEALEHFDSNCPDCRRAALTADPTLVFRRLPSLEMSAAQEASEVDAVVKAVTAMRTASRIERRSHAGGWKRWAAAAILVGASLSIPGDKRVERSEPAFRGAVPGMMVPSAMAAELPTLEQVNLPDARVYHMNGSNVAVAMVYDDSFGKLDV